MRIDIITLFPEICRAPLNESMMKRAQENGALDLHIHNLRAWTSDKHHVVDDAPFGGGQGMVMKPEPIFAAVEDLRNQTPNIKHQTSKVILMSPTGRRFDQQMAEQLSHESNLDCRLWALRRRRSSSSGPFDRRGNIHRRLCADERRDRSCDSG